MSRHVTYRGVTMDMDSLRRENEKTVAVGNMKVNAIGDQISGGKVTKTADQLARDNHRVQSAIIHTGLKGKQPDTDGINMDSVSKPKTPAKAVGSKSKEVELPSGDIIVEGNKNEN